MVFSFFVGKLGDLHPQQFSLASPLEILFSEYKEGYGSNNA